MYARGISCFMVAFLVCVMMSACGKQESVTSSTMENEAGDASSLQLRVGLSDKVSIPDPAKTSGDVTVELMGVPDFEEDYDKKAEKFYWTEDSKKAYPNYLADFSFVGIKKPVFVSSYIIGDFTGDASGISNINKLNSCATVTKKKKKKTVEEKVNGNCLALFVTEVPSELERMKQTSEYPCYIVILDYRNKISFCKETHFFLHEFYYWVDFLATDITNDGKQELLMSHCYNRALEFDVLRVDMEKNKLVDVYDTVIDYEDDDTWIDIPNDFNGELLDDYKVRIQYPSVGFDKTISMISDGGYKESELHDRVDEDDCPNFVGNWDKNGKLYDDVTKGKANVFLYVLSDIFCKQSDDGNMQIVFGRNIYIRHRSEVVGTIHAFLEYDKNSDSLVLKKVEYVDQKTTEENWNKKGYGKVRNVLEK